MIRATPLTGTDRCQACGRAAQMGGAILGGHRLVICIGCAVDLTQSVRDQVEDRMRKVRDERGLAPDRPIQAEPNGRYDQRGRVRPAPTLDELDRGGSDE